MKITRKRLIITLICVFSVIFCSLKVTYFNPAWSIAQKYPNANVRVHSINSADLYFWSSVANFFKIPMTDADHYLAIHIKNHPSPLSITDFSEVEELYIENSSIQDISAFWLSSSKLQIVVFSNCNFLALPADQKKLLSKESGRYVLRK